MDRRRFPPTLPILDRISPQREAEFWALVGKREPELCWPWLGVTNDGYGYFRFASNSYRANRVAWVLHNRKELGELVACHACDNKWCVNPHHIWPGTRGDNMRDAAEKKIRKHWINPGGYNTEKWRLHHEAWEAAKAECRK